MLHWCLIFIILNHVDVFFTDSAEVESYTMPDYDYYWTKKPNLIHSLSRKFALKKQNDEKLRKLKERISNDTEYFEDVPHFKIRGSEEIKKNSIYFEDFKKIMRMVGVTYTYKRDLYWRTWREVTYPNRSKTIVCYKCQNIVNYAETNCTDCHHGGYWAIEDTPPSCSLEILSFKGKKQLCAGNFWELNKINSEFITFRIINSSNDVIYSRIMKSNGENYACTEDCGQFNFDTMTLTRKEKPLILNLLKDYSRKRKRDNSLTVYNKGKTMNEESKNALRQSLFRKTHKYVVEKPFNTEKYPLLTSTLSFCNQIVLKEHEKDYYG